MNFRFNSLRNQIHVCLGLAAFFACSWLVSGPLTAQVDDAMVLKYGPNPAFFKSEQLELAVAGWKWQLQFLDRQIELVEATIAKWNSNHDGLQQEMRKLQAALAGVGLSFPVDSKTIQQLDSEIQSLESHRIGLRSQLLQLREKTAIQQDQLQLELSIKDNETKSLKKLLELNKAELQRVTQLHKSGVISENELNEIQLQVAELEGQIVQASTERELLTSKFGQQSAAELRAVSEEFANAEKLIKAASSKKEKILALQALQQTESLNFQTAMAQQMIQIAQTRKLELELEKTRFQALLELATEQFNKTSGTQQQEKDK